MKKEITPVWKNPTPEIEYTREKLIEMGIEQAAKENNTTTDKIKVV